MKRFLIIFLVLFIPSICFPGPLQQAHKKAIAGQTVASGTSTEFGNNNIEAGSGGILADNIYLFEIGAMPENGTLDSVHFYDPDTAAVAGLIIGLYSGTATVPSTRIFQSAGSARSAGAQWHSDTAGSEALTSGTTYYVAVITSASSDVDYAYAVDASFQTHAESAAYSSGMPATVSDNLLGNRKGSVYIMYTPD